eukprot:9126042-Lingulodinium_polyedra.AAC.1
MGTTPPHALRRAPQDAGPESGAKPMGPGRPFPKARTAKAAARQDAKRPTPASAAPMTLSGGGQGALHVPIE